MNTFLRSAKSTYQVQKRRLTTTRTPSPGLPRAAGTHSRVSGETREACWVVQSAQGFSSEGCSLPPYSLGGLYQQSLTSPDSAFLVLQLPSHLYTQTQTTDFQMYGVDMLWSIDTLSRIRQSKDMCVQMFTASWKPKWSINRIASGCSKPQVGFQDFSSYFPHYLTYTTFTEMTKLLTISPLNIPRTGREASGSLLETTARWEPAGDILWLSHHWKLDSSPWQLWPPRWW